MKKILLICTLLLLLVPGYANARPISYPGGYTLMLSNDTDSNAVHFHYTPNPSYSIGIRHEYFRGPKAHMDAAQLNYLIKRWNKAGSQANIYLKSGAGVAYEDGETEAAAFTGLATDWENRRYFASYENRFLYADDITKFAKHKARIGVAPYVGDFGDLHTWLMLQADYDAGAEDTFSVTPLVRFFKGPSLLEAGYNLDNGVLFNFVQRF
jgi:hypothetical protein